jgi:hypothetical protein
MGYQQIPLVSAGTDGNPRLFTGVPWITDYGFYEKYFETPTAEELADNIQQALSFVEANNDYDGNCEANTILIYAWNENDEGGWIMPTLNTDGTVDDSRLKAIKQIVVPKQDYETRAQISDLYSLSYNGKQLNGFNSAITNYEFRISGNGTILPEISAITTNKFAVIKIMRAAHIPGTDTIKVISEDGLTEKIYSVDLSIDSETDKKYNWDFKNKGDSEGWRIKWASHSNISVNDGLLQVNITGNYPELISPENLNIDTEIYKTIKIRLKNNTTSNDWYFAIYTSAENVKFVKMTPSTLDEEFREYIINLDQYKEWEGIINQIALLPARNVGSGIVEIDYIQLESFPSSGIYYADLKSKIYPNPNNGYFYFETDYKNWSGGFTLSVFNIHGEMIYTKNIKDKQIKHKLEINLKGIPAGIYFVRAESKTGKSGGYFGSMFLKN